MNNKRNSSERGQVLMLVVCAMVGLFAFTAIAVDGTVLYSDRRFGQNAADASALAGGSEAALWLENSGVNMKNFSCSSANVLAAMEVAKDQAITRAVDNGFDDVDLDVSDKDGVEVINCEASGNDKHFDVRVVLTFDTNTSFLRFAYRGPVKQTVETVVRVRPRKLLAFGNAVVALNPADCSGQSNGAGIHGAAGLTVTGAGIFTNGCVRLDGGPGVSVDPGCITYQHQQPEDTINPSCPNGAPKTIGPDDIIPPDDYSLAEEPDCGAPGAVTINLDNDSQRNSMINTATPITGLYCLHGSLRVGAHETLYGRDVTLYFMDTTGSLNASNTNSRLDIKAADPKSNYQGSALPGIVIYSAAKPPQDAGQCNFILSGGSNTIVEGTVLTPACNITALGNPTTDAYNSQLIGWNIEVGGASGTDVVFNENKVYTKPSYIDLWR